MPADEHKDIHDQLQELYGIELSAEMVSKITEQDPAGSKGVAVTSVEPCISLRLHGLHPL